MLTLGIRYLQGIAVGSHGQHGRVEWPPHPARVFMAMVAAHYQTGADPTERHSLLWLERQPPPDIHAPEHLPCSVVTQFVPVNDKAGPAKSPVHSLPITRHRIDRTFARASLAGDTVMLCWDNAQPPQAIATALAALCAKVTRIGHSTSLVQMWMADVVPEGLQHWRVDESSDERLRVVRHGTLALLDEAFNGEAVAAYGDLKAREAEAEARLATSKTAHKVAKAREKEMKAAGTSQEVLETAKAESKAAKASVKKAEEERDAIAAVEADGFPFGPPRQNRPSISTYAGYALAGQKAEEAKARCGVFSPHLAIFTLERVEGPYRSLDLACTLALTDRWREALASHANDLKPGAQSLLTGHAQDKSPLQSAHVAFLALGFVGHPHAAAHLPGIALALPHETIMPPDVSRAIRSVAGRVRELKLGRLGLWKVESSTMARPLETLRSATWTAIPTGATHWSTVTPIAYDQHPKARGKSEYLAEVAGMIRAGCERIGLPQPREVIVTPVSAHLGTPPAHAFPRLRRKDGSERRHTHAILIFDESICGPVLLGAGRYRGYGLCRPMEL